LGYKKFDKSVMKADFNKASFDLHQIAENLFNCLLLVFIRYVPEEHDLEKLFDNWISEKIGDDVSGTYIFNISS
jgi:HEPN domain-containing protein